MKYINVTIIMMVGLFISLLACTHEHGEDTHSHEDNSLSDIAHAPHGAALEPIAFTIRTNKSELFVEFKPLVLGIESRFAAHFTEMKNFKALGKGDVRVQLKENVKIIAEDKVLKPNSPGIFRLAIIPSQIGTYDLEFLLTTSHFSDTIRITGISVYSNEAEAIAANPPEPEGDEVSFTKEQAWKIDFAIKQVKRESIHEVIHTSGEIKAIKGEEKIVSAKSSGIVFFKTKNLYEGKNVRKGENLFTISSKGLLKSNMEEKYKVANSRVLKAKADFERAENLLKEQIIGLKEYERRKMQYSVAEAEFQTLSSSYNSNGQSVAASMTGFVKKVLVSDGQFVEEGMPLIELTSNKRLLLQAEVSQSHLPILHKIKSANFKAPYQDEVQSIDDYNGKLISYGNVIEQENSFIPVLFELDNLKDLISGSYVELFLLTIPLDNALVISKSALMQDYSLNYVYVQTGGESFEKREVKLGVDDGVNVQITSGLTEGEWVVTEGAYRIKMASMSSTIPAHGHEH